MSTVDRQNPDGTWSPTAPLQPTRILRTENWLRRHRLVRLADLLAAFDERGLG